MGKVTRRKFSSAFKAKVAIEAIKERQTTQELASKYELHPNQVLAWKKEFVDGADKVFGSEADPEAEKLAEENLAFYRQCRDSASSYNERRSHSIGGRPPEERLRQAA